MVLLGVCDLERNKEFHQRKCICDLGQFLISGTVLHLVFSPHHIYHWGLLTDGIWGLLKLSEHLDPSNTVGSKFKKRIQGLRGQHCLDYTDLCLHSSCIFKLLVLVMDCCIKPCDPLKTESN